jgi:hypothetical protein
MHHLSEEGGHYIVDLNDFFTIGEFLTNLKPGLASIPEASILYRYISVLVSVSVSANNIDILVHISY